jgi:hypothetical protein
MRIGDLVRGAHDHPISQRKSLAIVVEKESGNRFTIMWISGQITRRALCSGFRPEELEVISEGG